MDELWKHYAKKLDTEDHVSNDAIYMQCPE